MIVEQFIQWVMTAAPEKRAKATNALARAYIAGEFSGDDQSAAEAAMTFLLDDPDTEVREALAEALAGSDIAPRHVILALLDDAPRIGAMVAAKSPLLIDSELVDILAIRGPAFQLAVAMRAPISAVVSAALAEVGSLKACALLVQNPNASVLPSTLLRLAERFGHNADMQQLLLTCDYLPISARQLLLMNMSDALCSNAVEQSWMNAERADGVARDARDRATLTLVRSADEESLSELVEHLRDTEQLTPVLILRAICAGQIDFFAESLSVLSGIQRHRIDGILTDSATKAFRSIYQRAELPEEAYVAFSIAFNVYAQEGVVSDASDQYRFTRIMIERILEEYKTVSFDGVDELLAMLRRFSSETARDAAREFVTGRLSAA